MAEAREEETEAGVADLAEAREEAMGAEAGGWVAETEAGLEAGTEAEAEADSAGAAAGLEAGLGVGLEAVMGAGAEVD